MTYETAYSLEKGTDYNALDANQAYHDGILSQHDSFQCSEWCDFPLLCVNFRRKMAEGGRQPYFRTATPGVPHDCQGVTDFISPSNGTEEGENFITRDTTFLHLNIDLSKGFISSPSIKTETLAHPKDNTSKKATKTAGSTERTDHSNSNALSTLISAYYSDDWDNNSNIIKLLDGTLTSFNELFQDIDENNDLTNTAKVYFGKAIIEKRDTYYILRFRTECRLDDITSVPSILIHIDQIGDDQTLINRYDRLANSEEEFMLYFMGEIQIFRKFLQLKLKNRNRESLANIYVKQ